jgi:hypothetical protein
MVVRLSALRTGRLYPQEMLVVPQDHSAIGRILCQPGIEPATFRFVAQNLNHCATAVPSLVGEELFCQGFLPWLSLTGKEGPSHVYVTLLKSWT